MLASKFTSYDQLPVFLNAKMVAALLGISPASCYELMHQRGFPTLRLGSRMVTPRDKFIEWVEKQIK